MFADFFNQGISVNALNVTAIASDTDTNGIVIDTEGYEGGVFLARVTARTAGDVTISAIQEGALADGSDMADIPAERIQGTAIALDAANEHDKIGFFANERYVRVVLTSDNSADLSVLAQCILTDPNHGPVPAHTATL